MGKKLENAGAFILVGVVIFLLGGKTLASVFGKLGAFFIVLGIYMAFRAIKVTSARRSVQIACAKCDQYLGTANGFDSPCPRCGSNRYRRE
jgi:hypothetical protein